MEDAGKPSFDANAAWQRINDNRVKLDACPRHLFDELPLEVIRLGGKIECRRCGGLLDLLELNQYIRGYEAAGKSGNDILPGFREDDPEAEVVIPRSPFVPE